MFIKARLAASISAALLLTACGADSDNNQAPTFAEPTYSYTTNEDTSVAGQVTATDADNDTLSYMPASNPEFGSIALNADGSFVYTPNAEFSGQDQFTISASDGTDSVDVTVSISVNEVNDAPMINTVTVANTLSGVEGTVEASDAEGDTLTFAVQTQPTSGTEVVVNAANGEFSYVGNGAGQSFTLAVSDGALTTTQSIDLTPNYVTNEDKLVSYYASDLSNLKRAEDIIVSNHDGDTQLISDATTASDAYQYLAEGYAKNGFFEEATSYIENNINQLQYQAAAYSAISDEADEQGNISKGNELRALATDTYKTYLELSELENVAQDMGGFYKGMINGYNDVGAISEANILLTELAVHAAALGAANQEKSTAQNYIIGAFQAVAEEASLKYYQDQTAENLTLAVDLVDRFADIAQTAGYRVHSSAGNYEQSKSLYGSYASSLYARLFLISQDADVLAKGKAHLALLLSYYGDVDYDSSHNLTAKDYAVTTLDRASTYLKAMSGSFAAFYPELITVGEDGKQTGNQAIDFLLMDTSTVRDAYKFAAPYKAIAEVKAGSATIEAGLAHVKLYYETNESNSDNLRKALTEDLFLSTFNAIYSNPIHYVNYALGSDAAMTWLDATADMMESDYYLDDNASDVDDLIESDGCTRIAQLKGQFSADLSQAQAQMARCQTLADSYFGSTDVSTSAKVADAHRYMAQAWSQFGDTTQAINSVDVAQAAAVTLEELDDYLLKNMHIANGLASEGLFSEARESFDASMARIDETLVTIQASMDAMVEPLLSDAEIKDLEYVLDGLYLATEPDLDNGYMSLHKYLDALRANPSVAGYADAMADATSQINSALDKVAALSVYTADSIRTGKLYKNSNYYTSDHGLILQYAFVRSYDAALALIEDGSFLSSDYDALFAKVSQAAAQQDDFSESVVATVDTDLDGQANFFLPAVSEQAISESGLILDGDDDNDNIDNEADIAPLYAQ